MLGSARGGNVFLRLTIHHKLISRNSFDHLFTLSLSRLWKITLLNQVTNGETKKNGVRIRKWIIFRNYTQLIYYLMFSNAVGLSGLLCFALLSLKIECLQYKEKLEILLQSIRKPSLSLTLSLVRSSAEWKRLQRPGIFSFVRERRHSLRSDDSPAFHSAWRHRPNRFPRISSPRTTLWWLGKTNDHCSALLVHVPTCSISSSCSPECKVFASLVLACADEEPTTQNDQWNSPKEYKELTIH